MLTFSPGFTPDSSWALADFLPGGGPPQLPGSGPGPDITPAWNPTTAQPHAKRQYHEYGDLQVGDDGLGQTGVAWQQPHLGGQDAADPASFTTLFNNSFDSPAAASSMTDLTMTVSPDIHVPMQNNNHGQALPYGNAQVHPQNMTNVSFRPIAAHPIAQNPPSPDSDYSPRLAKRQRVGPPHLVPLSRDVPSDAEKREAELAAAATPQSSTVDLTNGMDGLVRCGCTFTHPYIC